MAAADLLIQCLDPVTNKVVTFTKAHRHAFKYSSTVPVGDARASWSIDCDQIVQTGLPAKRARITVYDPTRVTYPWLGVLEKPVMHIERGRLVGFDFTAIGAGEGDHQQFPDSLTFVDADHAARSTGRVIITDLKDAITHGLTRAPLVNGTEDFIATSGITLAGDTEDFRGHTPPQLWTAICSLTARLENPFIWLVYADDTGLPALHWLATPETPEYFEHGNAKRIDLGIDFGEIANQLYGSFRGSNTILRPDPDLAEEVDYSASPDLQTQYIDVSEEIIDLDGAEGFIEGLLNKFNKCVPTEGTVVLDRDIRTLYAGEVTPVMIPITEVRAGKSIELSIVQTPYLDAKINMLVMAAEYDEDSCTTTLSPTAISTMGRDARLITALAGRSFFNWSLTSPKFGTNPSPDLMKTWVLAENPNPGGPDPDPNKPGDRPNASWLNGYAKIDGLPSGNQAPNPPPSPPTVVPVMFPALVPVARSIEGLENIFGPLGGQIHPQALPEERVNYPAQFFTADDDGNLTDGERGGQDVQECWVDTITLKTLSGVVGTVTVSVDIYHWDDDSTDTDVFTISLSGAANNRIILDGSSAPLMPIKLENGDHIIWKVSGAGASFWVKPCLSAWKNWSKFPVLVGPSWVPGNDPWA